MGFGENNSDWSWANNLYSPTLGLYLLHENDNGNTGCTEGNLPLWKVVDIKYEVFHNKNDSKMMMTANKQACSVPGLL